MKVMLTFDDRAAKLLAERAKLRGRSLAEHICDLPYSISPQTVTVIAPGQDNDGIITGSKEQHEAIGVQLAGEAASVLDICWQHGGPDYVVNALEQMLELAKIDNNPPSSSHIILMQNAIQAFHDVCDIME